ncbi:MAG: hypothetical protein JSU07_03790 [Bacteroidetes bacterium]|nr:hypothetical protein [Bacteroidota bacterium]
MRIVFPFLIFLSITKLYGQDNVYTTNGNKIIATVSEVLDSTVVLGTGNKHQKINKSTILLIEYANGIIELYNTSEKEMALQHVHKKNRFSDSIKTNLFSLNTLMICNGDIELAAEKLLLTRKLGLGVFGNYSFNKYTGFMNAMLLLLSKAHKTYDFGAYLNLYFNPKNPKNLFGCGLNTQYTGFNFTSILSSQNQNFIYQAKNAFFISNTVNLNYTHFLIRDLFIRFSGELGITYLNSTCKEDFNFRIYRNTGYSYNTNVLPMLKLNINIGFKF